MPSRDQDVALLLPAAIMKLAEVRLAVSWVWGVAAMMMACLNKSSTLPGAGEPGGGGGGAPLHQLMLDQNKVIQVNLARSFWKGVGDIKVWNKDF